MVMIKDSLRTNCINHRLIIYNQFLVIGSKSRFMTTNFFARFSKFDFGCEYLANEILLL